MLTMYNANNSGLHVPQLTSLVRRITKKPHITATLLTSAYDIDSSVLQDHEISTLAFF